MLTNALIAFKRLTFLVFKCGIFFSFFDARRKFFQKVKAGLYARVTSEKKTNIEELQKIIECRTNTMPLIDISSKQSEKVMESLTALSNLIVNFMAKMSEDSPEKRKRPDKGDECLLK